MTRQRWRRHIYFILAVSAVGMLLTLYATFSFTPTFVVVALLYAGLSGACIAGLVLEAERGPWYA